MSEQQTDKTEVATRSEVLQVLEACGNPEDTNAVVGMAFVATSFTAQALLAKVDIDKDNLIESQAAILATALCIVCANLGYSDDDMARLTDATLDMYTTVMATSPERPIQ